MVSKFVESIIDKQFEMIGVKFRFADISESGEIVVGTKKKMWYDHYKFKDVEQYQEWRKYALAQLNGSEKEMNILDFSYGMVYEYKKEEVGTLPF